MKYRAYEHKVIEHNQVTKSWSTEEEIAEGNTEMEKNITQRKSDRLKEKKKVDYTKMNKGESEEKEEESNTTNPSEVTQHINTSTWQGDED